MAFVAVALLIIAVMGVLLRPFGVPAWASSAGCATVAVATSASSVAAALDAVSPLAAPIAFLLAAVPLAIALDRLGFFTELAARLIATGRGSGSLWILAAIVTTVLNLDASVVLLTPLYVQVARQTGRRPLTLAFQPVLLACLASTALPVSNLTNLIAVADTRATTGDFVANLALPSLVATSAGWWLYRHALDPDAVVGPAIEPLRRELHPHALSIGGAVLVGVLVGFVVGPSFGVEPWVVALVADLVLVTVARRFDHRALPLGTAIVALSLAVLAAAAVVHLPMEQLVHGDDTIGLARTIAVTAIAANVVNNLPALLVALPAVDHAVSPQLWAILIGVDMGPVVLATGSLASLLWLDAVNRLDVPVRPRDFTRVGVRVGLPAAAAGAIAFLVLDAIR